MMNKLPGFFVVLIFCYAVFFSPLSFASTDNGCLFCHQYPGLVRLQQDGALKKLQIDPESYRKSSHGELSCSDCHNDINKIPHVDANKVSCTDSCHQSEKDQALLTQTPIKKIHKDQQSLVTRMPDQTSCKVCHPVYPHSKQPFIRAWLNMHTGYIICETCHLKKKKYPGLRYQWITTKHIAFKGKSFGSYFDPDKKHTQSPESSLSRIVPVVSVNGIEQPLVNFEDTEKAQAFIDSGTVSNKENRAVAIAYYHRDIGKMKVATVCETCHSENGMLDFSALGFTEERATALINTNINDIISDYDTFYIPHIFK